MQRAFNIHSMYDSKLPLGDRIHTFEALSKKAGPRGQGQAEVQCCTLDSEVPEVIYQELLYAITQIKDHLLNECNIVLKEATFYFKFDKKDNLYLTFAAGIKAAAKGAPSE